MSFWVFYVVLAHEANRFHGPWISILIAGLECRAYPLSGGVCEAALAHVRDRVEAAYRRTNLFERRRQLMEDCATYLSGEDEVNFR